MTMLVTMPPPAASVTWQPRKAAIASVLAAMVLVVLDAAIANVALPTIAQSLQVAPAMSVWIVTAYQTALLMALLPCAALGESLGYRRVFAVGVALLRHFGTTAEVATGPIFQQEQIARAVELGLGVDGPAKIELVTEDPDSTAYAEQIKKILTGS